jgi:hypothetical protein
MTECGSRKAASKTSRRSKEWAKGLSSAICLPNRPFYLTVHNEPSRVMMFLVRVNEEVDWKSANDNERQEGPWRPEVDGQGDSYCELDKILK